MSYTIASRFGTDHNQWLSTIDFYKTELGILENRLTEIASKNTEKEVLAGVEHFQNQFIIQKNNIDELRHMINEHIQHVVHDTKKHAGRIEDGLVTEHEKMKEEFMSFEKVVEELRHEFNAYASKWM